MAFNPVGSHPNAAVIVAFYTSLQRSDFSGIRRCYAPGVVYWDPVFRELRGERALAMWDMICRRGDIDVVYDAVRADDETGSGRWEARYNFSKTGREVHNVIDSRFRFADGLICEHRDTFDVHRWAGMALGPAGRLLGWAPPMQEVLHRSSVKLIDGFLASRETSGNETSGK